MNAEQIHILVERSKQQDGQAFGQLIAEFQQSIFRFAFKMICDYNDAQDITQETFIRAWTHLNRFTFQAGFSTWLYKIAANLCYDLLRSRQRKLRNTGPLTDLLNSPDLLSDENPDRQMINQELSDIIYALTEQLTPKQKLVFTLCELQGLNSEEVQNITGLSGAKIKSNLYLARKQIQEKIAKLK